ncbi:hypothetical protein TNCT_378751 [Trichonephila clavata]|uniref:Uncharacterized protein n=1 Tax=Trichonephila clavata TaxID=2740835 RepID=A0A8X6H1Y7_TRICU|nr:hypothetical protein TNCT_378751 [Trichonephila clavata]
MLNDTPKHLKRCIRLSKTYIQVCCLQASSFSTAMQSRMSPWWVSRHWPIKSSPGKSRVRSRSITSRLLHLWTAEEKPDGLMISIRR